MNLKELFGFCCHKWVEVDKENWTRTSFFGEINYSKIYLKCKKCGILRSIEL